MKRVSIHKAVQITCTSCGRVLVAVVTEGCRKFEKLQRSAMLKALVCHISTSTEGSSPIIS